MPKINPGEVQKEIEAGKLRPLYWIFGGERMLVRELVKRIRKLALGGDGASSAFLESTLDANEVTCAEVVDEARSFSFGASGTTRVITIKDAHLLKDTDALGLLFEEGSAPRVPSELPSVCLFIAKDLDGRKKFSKVLEEKAVIVPCDLVELDRRETWIGYLCKRRGVVLAERQVSQLLALDPWSLDIIDQELEKFSLTLDPDVLQGAHESFASDDFMEALTSRNSQQLMTYLSELSKDHDRSMMMVGYIAYHLRQWAYGRRTGPWAGWTLSEMMNLQEALVALDFGSKQGTGSALGLWTEFAVRGCRSG